MSLWASTVTRRRGPLPQWATTLLVRADSKHRVAGYTAAPTDCSGLLEARRGRCSGPRALGGSEDIGGSRRLVIQSMERRGPDALELIEIE